MIDRLEAWLEHTPITGKRCGKGMYLPIIVLRSRRHVALVDSQADANP
jgi:predicted PolB exonuclease-like 3'-5' exonuclease